MKGRQSLSQDDLDIVLPKLRHWHHDAIYIIELYMRVCACWKGHGVLHTPKDKLHLKQVFSPLGVAKTIRSVWSSATGSCQNAPRMRRRRRLIYFLHPSHRDMFPNWVRANSFSPCGGWGCCDSWHRHGDHRSRSSMYVCMCWDKLTYQWRRYAHDLKRRVTVNGGNGERYLPALYNSGGAQIQP